MDSAPDYKVSVGKVARTLLYEDSRGTIRFGIDLDTAGGRNTVILERPASGKIDSIEDEALRMAEQSRMNLASDRTRQYLINRGYQVKIWPDEFEK